MLNNKKYTRDMISNMSQLDHAYTKMLAPVFFVFVWVFVWVFVLCVCTYIYNNYIDAFSWTAYGV